MLFRKNAAYDKVIQTCCDVGSTDCLDVVSENRMFYCVHADELVVI